MVNYSGINVNSFASDELERVAEEVGADEAGGSDGGGFGEDASRMERVETEADQM